MRTSEGFYNMTEIILQFSLVAHLKDDILMQQLHFSGCTSKKLRPAAKREALPNDVRKAGVWASKNEERRQHQDSMPDNNYFFSSQITCRFS